MAVTVKGKGFRKSERVKIKASILIDGTTGEGKSGLELAFADVFTNGNWDKVYGVDAENKSLDLYEGLILHTGTKIKKFNKVDLTADDGYSPENYDYFKQLAKSQEAEIFFMDSISHMWARKGGVLDMVNDAKEKNPKLDNYRVWGLPEIAKNKDLIFELIRDDKMHIIATVRVKEKHAMEYDEKANQGKGGNIVKALGEQQIQQEGIKYEADLVLNMVKPGSVDKAPVARVEKSRYTILEKGQEYEFTKELIQRIKDYLDSGVDPEIIEEQLRVDLCEAVKKQALSNTNKMTMYKTIYPDTTDAEGKKVAGKKTAELTIPEAREMLKRFMEVE